MSRSLPRRFWLLLPPLLTHFIFHVSATCYWQNSTLAPDDPFSIAPDDTACFPDQDNSPCCGTGWSCLSDGVCYIEIDAQSYYYRGTCTDRTWDSQQCPGWCFAQNSNTSIPLAKCDTDQDWYCCPGDPDCSCDTGKFAVKLGDTQPSTVTVIGSTTWDGLTRTGSTTAFTASPLVSDGTSTDTATATNTGTVTDSGSPLTTPTAPTSTSTSSSGLSSLGASVTSLSSSSSGGSGGGGTNNTGLAAGLGAGLGAAAVLIGVLVFFLMRARRRRTRHRNAAGGAEGTGNPSMSSKTPFNFVYSQPSGYHGELYVDHNEGAHLKGVNEPELPGAAEYQRTEMPAAESDGRKPTGMGSVPRAELDAS